MRVCVANVVGTFFAFNVAKIRKNCVRTLVANILNKKAKDVAFCSEAYERTLIMSHLSPSSFLHIFKQLLKVRTLRLHHSRFL